MSTTRSRKQSGEITPPPALLHNGWVWATAILLWCCIIYSNSLKGQFVFDDHGAAWNNPSIERLTTAFKTPPTSTVYNRPILNLSFAINYAISGYSITGYHIVNILIHIGCSLFLFGILRRTFLFLDWDTPKATTIAGVSALIWCSHPLHTESVTYIVQRAESLAGLWYLGALYAFTRAVSPGGKSRAWFAVSVITSAIGMATKEILATAPLMILLYDRTFVAKAFLPGLKERKGYYAALFATIAIVLYLAKDGRPGSAGFDEGVTPLQYLTTQFGVVLHYIYLSFIPHPLVFDYWWTPPKTSLGIIAPGIVIVGLAFITLALVWRNKPLGYAGAWFFAILAPSSSIIPIITEVAAEHRTYLPLASISLLVVLGIYSLAKRYRPTSAEKIVLLFSVIVSLIYGGLTISRNTIYHSAIRVWEDTVAKRPDNIRAAYNLGKELETVGRTEEAIAQYQSVLPRAKKKVELHTNLGLALAKVGRVAEALPHLHEATVLDPKHAEAHNNLALALAKLGRVEEAIPLYRKAIELKPDYPEGHYNYANALAATGKMEEATRHYERATALNPDFPTAYFNWGYALETSGRTAEAIQTYLRAATIKPDYAKAYYHAALLQQKLGEERQARENLQRAAQLNYPPAVQALSGASR